MRRLSVTVFAAMLGLASIGINAAASAQSASLQIKTASNRLASANVTLIAAHLRCGGPRLRCGPGLAKVCNPKNNKCCCAVPGEYH